jgi:uncharacterized protein YggE
VCAGERGTARPEVLQSLLGTTQHVVQEIDSVEYGLTDIQEYYANTGALTNAATSAQVCVRGRGRRLVNSISISWPSLHSPPCMWHVHLLINVAWA